MERERKRGGADHDYMQEEARMFSSSSSLPPHNAHRNPHYTLELL